MSIENVAVGAKRQNKAQCECASSKHSDEPCKRYGTLYERMYLCGPCLRWHWKEHAKNAGLTPAPEKGEGK